MAGCFVEGLRSDTETALSSEHIRGYTLLQPLIHSAENTPMSLLRDIQNILDRGRAASAPSSHEDLLTTLLVMAWMVEARDPYTGGHLWRVSQYAQLLAARAGLPAEDVSRIAVGAFLHDLGKISVPDAILGKRDRLSEAEYAIIKTHPDVGWRMLVSHPLARLAEHAVRSHHETPDGTGYPRGLPAPDIAMDAKIVGICDAFDAMTSTRPYRQGMPTEQALSVIEERLGRQFDSQLGRLFIEVGRQGDLSHIVGHSDLGIPLQACVMCGPIIAIPRAHPIGVNVYCPACTREYAVQKTGTRWSITPTGHTGSAANMAPTVDPDVLADIVRASARALLGRVGS